MAVHEQPGARSPAWPDGRPLTIGAGRPGRRSLRPPQARSVVGRRGGRDTPSQWLSGHHGSGGHSAGSGCRSDRARSLRKTACRRRSAVERASTHSFSEWCGGSSGSSGSRQTGQEVAGVMLSSMSRARWDVGHSRASGGGCTTGRAPRPPGSAARRSRGRGASAPARARRPGRGSRRGGAIA